MMHSSVALPYALRGFIGSAQWNFAKTMPESLVAAIPADKKLYQRQIEATDEETDALVYELYGLTEEEITIVEWRDH